MHEIDHNLLPALDALLQEGSVAKAAVRLQLSAPAMSRALGRIRDATGDPILVRAGRGLVATPRALAIRDRVRAAVEETRALLGRDPPRDPRSFQRALTMRVDDAVTAVLAPPLLAAVRAEAPGVTLVFRAEGDEQADELRDGSVDLDIGVQGALPPEIRTRALLHDTRVVLVRDRGGRGRRTMTVRQLAAADHVDVSRRGRLRGPIDDVLARAGLTRVVRAVVANQLAAAVIVAQTDAVSLVSQRFATAIRGVLPVRGLAAPAALGSAAVAMAWHPRFDADPAHAWCRRQLVRIAREMPGG